MSNILCSTAFSLSFSSARSPREIVETRFKKPSRDSRLHLSNIRLKNSRLLLVKAHHTVAMKRLYRLSLHLESLLHRKCVCQKRFFATSDYSETIHLPKTSFPIKHRPAKEHEYFERCGTSLYTWQDAQKKRPLFTLHDGPPYANGDLHIGHAVNKVLKDIINRYKILQGYRIQYLFLFFRDVKCILKDCASYVPGWDCHGLPIELKALTALGKRNRQDLTPLRIREVARQFALEAVDKQKESFRSWNILGDWENAYKTLGTLLFFNQRLGDMSINMVHIRQSLCG